MKMNKKGFTLIEMLVVIAIIAVLVAIVIPTVTSATEKAKEAADAANIRAAIAEVTTQALSGETITPKTVTLKQTGSFDKNTDLKDIGGLALSNFNSKTSVTIGWANDAITVNGAAATPATNTPASTACTVKLADNTTCTGTVTNGTCSNAANHPAD